MNNEPLAVIDEGTSSHDWAKGICTNRLLVLTVTEDADVAVMVGADGSDETKTLSA